MQTILFRSDNTKSFWFGYDANKYLATKVGESQQWEIKIFHLESRGMCWDDNEDNDGGGGGGRGEDRNV